MAVYEVWCHSCNVTFAPEARRCTHCGGRLQADPPGRRLRDPAPIDFKLPSMGFGEAAQLPPQSTPSPSFRSGSDPANDPIELEEEPVKRSLLRAGMTVLWMVLLAAGYAWRACSQ